MNRVRRLAVPLAAALVAAAVVISPAAAKGGGGSTPPPTAPTDPCAGYWDSAYTDGSSALVNASAGAV